MNTHGTILMNSRAGALHATAGLEQVRVMVREIGLEAEVVGTESAEEMCLTIRQLVKAGAGRIAVAGGDGTVALAVQELAHTPTVLGIIPQGTANNFATALRLPQDLPSALRVLLDGEVREVDLGKVYDRYFTEAAGVGLFADALALYGTGTNKAFFRAFWILLRLVLSLKAPRIRLSVDGDPHTERAVMCTVANTYRMGYAAALAPGAKITDGELDVVIVGDLTRGELFAYYRAIRAQMHLGLPKVSSLRAKEVTIMAGRRLNVHCDDQVVGTTPVTISAQPKALKVLVERL
jgi:diacylglycerol kinase (ATP)